MTVAELIELLKTLPQNYIVMFDGSENYGDVYNIKGAVLDNTNKIVELYENNKH